MGRNKKDISILIGKKFGRLTILKDLGNPNVNKSRRIILAVCECGVIKTYQLANLMKKTAPTKSCGCHFVEMSVKANTTHGGSHHPLYNVWSGMKKRCLKIANKDYHNYGGRGVVVCKEWLNGFSSFYNWAIDKWKPGLQLDKDKLGNGLLYSPETCCFISRDDNNRLKRNSICVEYDGVRKTISEWSKETGISAAVMFSRRNLGWSPSMVVSKNF
jgi:hypothetical protein